MVHDFNTGGPSAAAWCSAAPVKSAPTVDPIYYPPEQYTRLLAGLVHKLNNVITVLSGHTGLLLLQPKLSRSVKDPIEQMAQATMLLSRYLDEAVIVARSPKLNLGPVDLVAVLRSVCERSATPMALFQPPGGLEVYGDAPHLQAALDQLMRNAAEAEATKVVCTVTDAGDRYNISLRDNGTGINPESLQRIFEPFFTTRKNQDNMGIGLFRVQGYLAVTGGTLAVKSDGKSYSDFCLSLPKVRPA
ncbi:MAG TPA: HAMP domain-containing sensor histidine kinase [Chthoniobacterales bacterium]